jgi:hypothetical protein
MLGGDARRVVDIDADREVVEGSERQPHRIADDVMPRWHGDRRSPGELDAAQRAGDEGRAGAPGLLD